MNRVLVTSAGAGPAIALIKALKRRPGNKCSVVAVDISPRAAGLYLADKFQLVPKADAPEFIDVILDLCRREGIELVIPIFDAELLSFSHGLPRFNQAGIQVAVNPPACIELSGDKEKASDLCSTHGISQPRRFSSPLDAPADAFPLLGKPAIGRGALDQIVVRSPSQAASVEAPAGRYLWQELIRGTEYSVDTFGSGITPVFVAVPRERIVVKAGQTVVGRTVRSDEIEEYALRVCSAFGATQVCCLQLFRTAEGELKFIELNPRYGTGISLSIAAGVDFPLLQWLSLTNPSALQAAMTQFKAGLQMIRYWEELYQESPP